jgi:NTP pyrophosphatase (non-canonical NTP hydrolase)
VKETQQSISEWADATFGGAVSCMRVGARANEEMAELLRALSVEQPEQSKCLEETADIVIILYRLATRLGGDLHEEINKKMAVNRTREWKRDGSGHGYHERRRTMIK